MGTTRDKQPLSGINQEHGRMNGGEKFKRNAGKKKKKDNQDDLSEEDKQKKEELELLVQRIQDEDEGVVQMSLDALIHELKVATSSMTSVPKPLKFLSPHYDTLVQHYNSLANIPIKKRLADVLSVLSATCCQQNSRNMLKYRLEGTMEGLTNWSQEYLRNLSAEISVEFNERQKNNESVDELVSIVLEIVGYYMKHGAECDAVDLLCDVEKIESLIDFIDDNTFKRVVLYLQTMSNYAASYEECLRMMKVVFDILLFKEEFPDALRVAMKINSMDLVMKVFEKCEHKTTRMQLAIMCGRQKIELNLSKDEDVQRNYLRYGDMLTKNFQLLAKELDVLESKSPEDVYKTHLQERSSTGVTFDSAKYNLASTFVNAFVNAAFCSDTLMTVKDSKWLFKNKDHGMISAAASMGVLFMWNSDEGLNKVNEMQYANDLNIKAGTLMAFGLVACGIKSEDDPVYYLLLDRLDSTTVLEKLGAIVGFGFAYAGSHREDILEALAPCVIDTSFTVECSAMAALSLGLVFVGSKNREAAEAIMQVFIEEQIISECLDGPLATIFAVGLGLLFLGCREECDVILAALEAIKHPIRKYASITVEGMAYANSGDVLKVQRMLKILSDKRINSTPAAFTSGSSISSGSGSFSVSSSNSSSPAAQSDEEDDMLNLSKVVAVMNIPLIAMGEDVGSEMTLRMLDEILQYGDIHERRGVPLALALHSASNPRPNVVDLLSKLSHDSDPDVALSAIMSLGFVGAGTNNSRIAALLRDLASYYCKDTNALFVVRISQGLLYLGKGLLSINPLHSDRFLINQVSLGCLLVFLHGCVNLRRTILGRQHYLMYHLVPAMFPRMLITVDEELQPFPVSVRVGQAVDTIGQAGLPKTITGFHTHITPVLLSYGERAELATDEYLPVTNVLEGVVILRKNPEYKPTVTA